MVFGASLRELQVIIHYTAIYDQIQKPVSHRSLHGNFTIKYEKQTLQVL